MDVKTTSALFNLDRKDLLKGLLIAILSPVFTILIQSLDAGSLVFDWKYIASTALAAALTYILKNFLTPGEVVVTQVPKETVDRVNSGELTAAIVPKDQPPS